MAQPILVLPGTGGAQLPGLMEALQKAGQVTLLPPNADISRVREAYRHLDGGKGKIAVVSLGAGWVQALLLAQAFPVGALVCIGPGIDGKAGVFSARLAALANLFAITAPTLLVQKGEDPIARRIFARMGGSCRMLMMEEECNKSLIATILQHVRPIQATDLLANRHDLGII